MSIEIHKVRVRAAFKVRRNPYWGPAIAGDLTLGFRKIGETEGTWIARLRVNEPDGKRYAYESFGLVTAENDYEAARAKALKWREARDAGVTDDAVTVADACREYVEDREREKGRACAHDAQKRFERTVFGTTFGATRLDKLKAPRVKAWRDGLELSKASKNRTLTALKAALNLAVAHRRVHPSAAFEWGRSVKPYPKASKRRDLFLDLAQRRALIEATSGALRNLVEAAALTGARAGELTNARRSQFDARTETMTFHGKTGTRTVRLPPAALALLKRVAESKLPTAQLFVRDDGRPWAHSDWDELVRAAAEKAKLPRAVCLYTMRHSFITQALSDGMRTLEVARFVGTSLTMIEKHYGHIVATDASERLAKVAML
jgi:integrase